MSLKDDIEDGLASLPNLAELDDNDQIIVIKAGNASITRVKDLRESLGMNRFIKEGDKAVVIGDSRARQEIGSYTSTDRIAFDAAGIGFNWMQALLGHPLTHNVKKNYGDNDSVTGKLGHNKGIGGDTTSDVLARMANDVLALQPNFVLLIISTNDLKSNVPLATIIEQYKQIIDNILNWGASLAVVSETPREGANDWDDDAERRNMFAVLNFTESYVTAKREQGSKIAYVNAWDLLRDHFGTDYSIESELAKDGLHLNNRGSLFVARAMINALSAWDLKDLNRHYSSVLTDIWDATSNPYGNIAPNPALTGTGGVISDGTGSIADDWRIQQASGSNSTCVVSTVPAPDGGEGNAIKLTITSDGNGTNNERWLVYQRNYTTGASEGIVAGETYRAQVRIKVTNMTGELWKQTQLELFDNDGGRNVYGMIGDSASVNLPADEYDYLARTPFVTYDENANNVRMEIDTYLDGTVAGSFDVYIWHPDYRYLESEPDYA